MMMVFVVVVVVVVVAAAAAGFSRKRQLSLGKRKRRKALRSEPSACLGKRPPAAMLTRVVLLVDAMFCEQATNREAAWLQDFLCNVLYEADRQAKTTRGVGEEDDDLVWGYQVVNGLDEKLDYCFANHIIKPAIANCQAKPLPNLHRCSQSRLVHTSLDFCLH